MLVEAACAITAMHALVRVFGVRSLHDALARSTSARLQASVAGNRTASERVREVASLMAKAARHVPGDYTCLHRSMALWWMLRRRGFDGRLRLGVRKGRTAFEAHAWVEYAGDVLNDDPDVERRYEPLPWQSVGRDL